MREGMVSKMHLTVRPHIRHIFGSDGSVLAARGDEIELGCFGSRMDRV